jgi:FkbM family methyltransferase
MSTYRFELLHPRFVAQRLRRRPLMEMTLDELAAYLPAAPVILEAGACDGSDTVRFAERWPRGTIHAFEPVPHAYAGVLERTRSLVNVSTYELALSDETGAGELHLSEDAAGGSRPDSSSLLAPTGHLDAWPSIKFRRTVTVQTQTLDGWADEHSIRAVDLMWLDLQGMELRVLQASPQLVSRTSAIHLEVWREPMYEGAPLYDDVVAWMSRNGFGPVIDRVHRVFGNILFVRR